PLLGSGTLNVAFTNQTNAGTLPLSGRLWDFGNGMTSTANNPTVLYTVPDVYTVSLTVTSALGDDTFIREDYVVLRPQAAFSATPTSGPAPLSVTFADETDPGNLTINSRFWEVGSGGATSQADAPV